MDRGRAKESPIVYGQALKNRVCPYCAVIMTKGTGTGSARTEEHLLPRGLTGSRTYDFLACQKCNNKKARQDDILVSIARMGNWSPHLQDGFDKMLRSEGGQKSVIAFLKHFNLSSRRERADGNYTIESDDAPIIAFLEWLKWIVRGAYFLETGTCLKPKEKLRPGGYFIRPTLLPVDDRDKLLTRQQRRDVQRVLDKSFRHPQLQTFGGGSVHFLCESTKIGLLIFLGKEYLLGAIVTPYKKKDFLKSINEQLDYFRFLAPDIQGRRAVDVRNGTLILQ